MKSWRRVEPTIITKIDYHEMVIKSFQTPEDNLVTRSIFRAEGLRCAGVVAVTEDLKVIVAEQFRPGPERLLMEIPGGGVDHGEAPEDAARRELREETGYSAKDMTFLGEFPRDAYMNGIWFYYLATGCRLEGVQELDEHEIVDVKLVDIDAFIENAKQGNMTDPFAVLAACDKLRMLQKEG